MFVFREHENWENVYPLIFLRFYRDAFMAITFPLFNSNEGQQTKLFANTQIEWMSDQLQKQFDATREGPFELK